MVCIAFASKTYTILRWKSKNYGMQGAENDDTKSTHSKPPVKHGDGPILLQLPVKRPALLVI